MGNSECSETAGTTCQGKLCVCNNGSKYDVTSNTCKAVSTPVCTPPCGPGGTCSADKKCVCTEHRDEGYAFTGPTCEKHCFTETAKKYAGDWMTSKTGGTCKEPCRDPDDPGYQPSCLVDNEWEYCD